MLCLGRFPVFNIKMLEKCELFCAVFLVCCSGFIVSDGVRDAV